MQIVRALWESVADLFAADTANFANASAVKVHLAAAPFTPGLDLALGSLTAATFTGSTALSAGTGTQPTYYDAVEGVRVMELLEPAGGWHWHCTVSPVSPETIYGFYVTDNAGATLLGAELLDAPVTISAAGQGIDVGFIKLRFRSNDPY
jgi:hypothetical protein